MADQSSLTVAFGEQIECTRGSRDALIQTTGTAPLRAEPIGLDRKATSAQAFIVIATSCLRQIAVNQAGVRAGSDEAVHQMRVGLRRLRAALSIFKNVFREGEFDDLKRELGWLTEQLAAAREYHVLIEANRKFEDSTGSILGAGVELSSELARRQQEALAVAARAVASVRFERLVFATAVTLITRADRVGTGDRPVRDLARRVFERRRRHLLQGLAHFTRLGSSERHALRIRVKKLRYATEFFASLFPNTQGKRERFSRALQALQDTLGRLNDITVHQQISRQMVEDQTDDHVGRRIVSTMGALTGSEQVELRSLSTTVPKLRRRLAKTARYWR